MAVKLLAPWHDLAPGAVVDRGEATDAKLITMGIAEKVVSPSTPIERAVRQPKEKRNGSA